MPQITKGAVWLVTGCSTGFGREVATQLLRQKSQVVVTTRDPADLGGSERAISAIIGAVEGPNPPHHLLLGNAAFDGAIAKLTELRHDFEAWEAISRGADFPKDAAVRAA